MKGYDPIKLSSSIAKHVVDGDKRKYTHLGRPLRFYGGISSAYIVTCNIFCKMCWAGDNVFKPGKTGRFYSPEEVFLGLVKCATRHNHQIISVSGGEITLGRDHLLSLLEHVEASKFQFICESNGLLLGHDPQYVSELSRFDRTHFRISLKGSNKEEFSRITGARPEAYQLQYKALENLIAAGVSVNACLMASFSTEEDIQNVITRLEAIHPGILKSLEIESISLFPQVKKRLEKAGLKPRRIRHRGRIIQLDTPQ